MIQDDQDVSHVSNIPVVADEISQFYIYILFYYSDILRLFSFSSLTLVRNEGMR